MNISNRARVTYDDDGSSMPFPSGYSRDAIDPEDILATMSSDIEPRMVETGSELTRPRIITGVNIEPFGDYGPMKIKIMDAVWVYTTPKRRPNNIEKVEVLFNMPLLTDYLYTSYTTTVSNMQTDAKKWIMRYGASIKSGSILNTYDDYDEEGYMMDEEDYAPDRDKKGSHEYSRRIDTILDRFVNLQNEGLVPLIDMDQLHFMHDTRDEDMKDAEMEDLLKGYDNYVRNWGKRHMENVKRLENDLENESYSNRSGEEERGSSRNRTMTEMKRNFTEAYRAAIEEMENNPSERNRNVLYRLTDKYAKDMIYTSPYLIRKHFEFAGVVCTDEQEDANQDFQTSLLPASNRAHQIAIVEDGDATMVNDIGPDTKPFHRVVADLTKHKNEFGHYTYCVPFYNSDYDPFSALYKSECYSQTYMDPIDGRIHSTKIFPGTKKTYWYIGTIQHNLTPGTHSSSNYGTARGYKNGPVNLDKAISARSNLPLLTMQVKK